MRLHLYICLISQQKRTTSWFVLTKKCTQCVYLYSCYYAIVMFLFQLPWCLGLYPSCGPTQRKKAITVKQTPTHVCSMYM